MKKIVISSSIITCKQVRLTDLHKPSVDELKQSLIAEGYTWPKFYEDMNYYKVKYEGEIGIGIGPYDGESVITDLEGRAESFSLDDYNVKFTPMSYTKSLKSVPSQYEIVSPKDLHKGDKVFIRKTMGLGKFESAIFLGQEGSYDRLPIWSWRIKDGTVKRSYSATFYQKKSQLFTVEYEDCGDWYSLKTGLTQLKAKNFVERKKKELKWSKTKFRIVGE